jgi:hypothetical protein
MIDFFHGIDDNPSIYLQEGPAHDFRHAAPQEAQPKGPTQEAQKGDQRR